LHQKKSSIIFGNVYENIAREGDTGCLGFIVRRKKNNQKLKIKDHKELQKNQFHIKRTTKFEFKIN